MQIQLRLDRESFERWHALGNGMGAVYCVGVRCIVAV